MKKYVILIGVLWIAIAEGTAMTVENSSLTVKQAQEIINGADDRMEQLFQEIITEPFTPGALKNFENQVLSRSLTCSRASYAFALLYKNTRVEEANKQIREIYAYYTTHPEDISWQHDSMAWAGSLFTRLIIFFGQDSKYFPGRLEADTEKQLLDVMWGWANYHSKVALATRDQAAQWYIHGSENHDAQRYMPCWGFARIFKDHEVYSEMAYADGHLPEEHYKAWTAYFKQYLSERAKRGLFVEKATNFYAAHTLKGIFDLYDFSDDLVLKKRAGMLLNLWFAAWSEEQIDGVRGGGKARLYQGNSSKYASPDTAGQLAWYFLGIGDRTGIDWGNINVDYTAFLCALTSSYRPSPVVVGIAYDPEEKTYEIRQRCMGLAKAGYWVPPDYILPTAIGGIYRYSYKTPEFILGTLMFPARPGTDWTLISSQNRWHGVILKGHPHARIYPQCQSTVGNRTYNQQWSAQSKGTLIAQKLNTSTESGDMRVWFSGNGLSNRIEKGGWVFAEAQGAYAAVRPAYGDYTWDQEKGEDRWLRCLEQWAPVIMEVADKASFPDYAAFRKRVLKLPIKHRNNQLEYGSLYGDSFLFYTDYSKSPEINGKPVDYTPEKVYDSPFIQGRWGEGRITLTSSLGSMVLDFGDPTGSSEDGGEAVPQAAQ